MNPKHLMNGGRLVFAALSMCLTGFTTLLLAAPPTSQTSVDSPKSYPYQISQLSKIPSPNAHAYEDCLVTAVVAGADGLQFTGIFWAFQNRKLTRAAFLQQGDRFDGKRTPWEDTPPELRSKALADDLDFSADTKVFFIDNWETKRELPPADDSPYAELISRSAYYQRSVDPPFIANIVPPGFHATTAVPSVSCSVELPKFIRHLRAEKIEVLLFPIPNPRSVHPDSLPGVTYSVEEHGLPNAGITSYLKKVATETGAHFVDTAKELRQLSESQAVFMSADHHWSPLSGQHMAGVVAEMIPKKPSLTWDRGQDLPEPVEWLYDNATFLRHPVLTGLGIKLENNPVNVVFLPHNMLQENKRVAILGDSNVAFPERSGGILQSGRREMLSGGFASHLEFLLEDPVYSLPSSGDCRDGTRSTFLGSRNWQDTEYVIWMIHETDIFHDWKEMNYLERR